ncbi:hypothetical protein KEJ36_01410 [Candidatus Bathyarchaeota archaeon]|nr:hypothetical protein [Candidatus Bathyarchaeota archaeon]MBS7627476.1 hypothetical protein [Candidatus Bathyarchaeota archaeon]
MDPGSRYGKQWVKPDSFLSKADYPPYRCLKEAGFSLDMKPSTILLAIIPG